MRFFACLLALALVSAALPSSAQEPVRPKDSKEQAQPPRPRPRTSTLDELFERLGKAQSEREAEGISSLIERRFSRSGSDTADLLLQRAGEAYGKKDFPLAIELIDRVLVLQPNWAEAWYKRATVFYQLDDPVGAMADLNRAIRIEPRHFNAWTGLGHILMASDDKVHALVAYRRVLAINPQMSDVKTIVNRLSPEVDGQDL
ncbi:tetratricopeptide repeat protein [Microvirga mediterraneensis]|uniref:Tetratricopeptide repeat protein n=1 Tax=Microvirga mediterraneensis TaxID=2754695 RepID=A0A838BJK8_9HYPH|nr:tetratricopeptide repeat protein [Microvirga mediterraneensis]MBA1155794.1 tetratricopeptide repeat protein [Microvirga mediterraneensis]